MFRKSLLTGIDLKISIDLQETEQTNFEGKTDVDAVQQEIRSQNRKKAQIQKDINSLENDISIMQKSMEAR